MQGGYYDQHPDLLVQWSIIDEAYAEVEDWKEAQRKHKAKQGR